MHLEMVESRCPTLGFRPAGGGGEGEGRAWKQPQGLLKESNEGVFHVQRASAVKWCL